MNTEIPLIESVLFGSPYSGCRCFSGWAQPATAKIPRNTSWPSPYGQGATMCVDQYREQGGNPSLLRSKAIQKTSTQCPGASIQCHQEWQNEERSMRGLRRAQRPGPSRGLFTPPSGSLAVPAPSSNAALQAEFQRLGPYPARLTQPLPQNVQRVHFRPSAPYPSWVLGPGGDPLKPMPRLCPQAPGKPPYNLHALSFPSTTGAWNTRITGGISGDLPDCVICSIGQFSQHNLGWT